MSTSKNRPRLEVKVASRIPSKTEITILDGFDVAVKQSTGSLVRADLPRGLYTVRLEHAGVTVEHLVRHVGPDSLTFEKPRRHSSLPVSGTSTTREYYQDSSAEWSKKDTRDAIGGKGGRIFVFVRAISRAAAGEGRLANGLKLLDAEASTVTSFSASDVKTDSDGWSALSACARPGVYYLYHQGEKRAMPLHVFAGWNTQAFITHTDRAARIESASVLTPSVRDGFDPNDHIASAVDLALESLKSGKNFIPPGPRNELLHAKFRNPMLGILGAYLLLLGRNRLPEKKRLDWDATRRIIDRIDRLVRGSSDVRALKLLAEEIFEQRWPGAIVPLEHPPMVRAGLDAAVRASVRRPRIIPAHSLTEEASVKTNVDSPWTTWDSKKLRRGTVSGAPLASPWVKQYMRRTISSHSDSGSTLDLAQIAGGARLPMGLVERTYLTLGKPDLMGDATRIDLTQIRGIGDSYQRSLQALGIRDFEALASLDKGIIHTLPDRLGTSQGQVKDWVSQARRLAKGTRSPPAVSVRKRK